MGFNSEFNLLLLKLSYLARKVDVNRAEQLLPGAF